MPSLEYRSQLVLLFLQARLIRSAPTLHIKRSCQNFPQQSWSDSSPPWPPGHCRRVPTFSCQHSSLQLAEPDAGAKETGSGCISRDKMLEAGAKRTRSLGASGQGGIFGGLTRAGLRAKQDSGPSRTQRHVHLYMYKKIPGKRALT